MTKAIRLVRRPVGETVYKRWRKYRAFEQPVFQPRNGRVASTYIARTASGAINGSHGNCNGKDVATNPMNVNPTAPAIVGQLPMTMPAAGPAACRQTR